MKQTKAEMEAAVKRRFASKMVLYLPTRGRVDNQYTLQKLPKEWRERTIIVCPKDEVKAHTRNWKDVAAVLPEPKTMTLAQKRIFIFEHAVKKGNDKIIQIDDDLQFFARKRTLNSMKGFRSKQESCGATWKDYKERFAGIEKLTTAHPTDGRLTRAFHRIEHMLSLYAHGGLAPRMMNQNFGAEFTMNMRTMCCLAYHVPTVVANCNLGQIECRQDFDYILQMMRKGFPNAVYTWAVHEQARGFSAKGGVSTYRTAEVANRDARKLARLHPGIVRVVKKEYKGTKLPRIEVVISWDKAIAEGEAYKMGLL